MTIKELYKWAIENEVENANIVFCALYGAGEIKYVCNRLLDRQIVFDETTF